MHGTRFASICLVVAFLVSLASPSSVNAQVLYGSILGTVQDQSGAVLPGASVSIMNTNTGQSRETTTNQAGNYSIKNVQAGSYDLTATADGFRPFTQTGVIVTINTDTRVNMDLQVGAMTESVTVEASAAVLQTESADVKVELSQTAIQNLPIGSYRNYQELINLVPGATPGRFQNAITDTPALSLTTNVNGTNRNSNNQRLDGAANIFVWLPHHAAYVAPVETIETVNIATNNFDAEQGTTGGAAITVVTKSGTNEFHGSAFEIHDDNGLRAFRWEENRSGVTNKPHSVRNIFGGTIGGPIKKDKVFFFVGWEANYERLAFSRTYSVPRADLRGGDFSRALGADLLDGGGAQIMVPTTEGGNVPMQEGMIFDPYSGNPDGSGRSVFSDGGMLNVIPAADLNPGMMAMLARVPNPNLAGDTSNLFRSGVGGLNRNNHDFKVNWNRTASHQLWFKYSVMDAQVNGSYGLDDAGGRCLCNGGAGVGDTFVQMATIGQTWTVSPTFLIDGTIGWTRMGQSGLLPEGVGDGNFGLDVLDVPGANGVDPRTHGMPPIDIQGFSTLGHRSGWMPAFRNDQSYTYSTNAAWLKNDHDIRFGFDLVHHHLNHWQPESGGGPRGRFDFNRDTTATSEGEAGGDLNALAAFMIGSAGDMAKSIQNIKMDSFENQMAFYIRDRWHLTPKFTLNLGVRWELYPTRTRSNGLGIESYDFATNEALIGGRGSVPRDAGVGYSKKLFAPRLGIVYRLSDNTVVRAGYGITYNPMVMARPLRGSFPLTIAASWSGDNGFLPFTTDPTIVSAGVMPNLPLGTANGVGFPDVVGPDISSGRVLLPLSVNFRHPIANKQLTRGYIQSWNFTVEEKLPGSFVTSIAYVGTAQIKGFNPIDLNASQIPGSGNAGRPLFAPFNRTRRNDRWDGWTNSNYHSLQVALNRRMVDGLFVKAAYTFSKAINMEDDDGTSRVDINALNFLSINRGPAGYNIPHIFRFAYVYELPFGNGKKFAADGAAAKILGGWQINGIFSSFQGRQVDLSSSSSSLNMPGNDQHPDQIGTGEVATLGGVGDVTTPFFDISRFEPVTTSSSGGGVRFGNVGRNTIRGPGVVNMDLSVFRTFGLTESINLQFRAEAFNLSNTPHFNNPNGNASSGNFGRITSTNLNFKERQLRFGLKLHW